MPDQAEDQSAVVEFLASGAWAGVSPDRVSRIETHGALVFLAGDRVCKIKRAVEFPYMDFSTLEKRRRACETELRLNRRAAPRLYLSVEPITRSSGDRLSLGGAGTPVEWCVLMRRFPQEALLDRMAEEGRLTRQIVIDLAAAIAGFHADAERAGDDSPYGGEAAVRATLTESLQELSERPTWFAPDAVERVRQLADAQLGRSAAVLDARKRAGFVRQCHGDLHLGNVCLLEGRPTLFDAIEFNEALSWVDVLHDLAFMLMDLDHRGLRAFAALLLTQYAVETDDLDGLDVLPLLLADRALVRAKVKAATADATGERGRLAALQREAQKYFEAAQAYLRPPPARLVAVGGLSGTGKSTLAGRIAPKVGPAPGAVHLRSDVIRKRLAGVPESQRLDESFYSQDWTRAVYKRMIAIAGRVLASGHAVVLDAVFARVDEREAVQRLAAKLGVGFRGLWLEAPLHVMADRVERRSGDASDATAEIVHRQVSYELGRLDWHKVSAEGPPETVEAAARRALDA